MKSTDHLKMPELVSTQYEVQLSADERKRYEELKQDLVLELHGDEITAANAATLTGKLSQLANGAIYSDDGKVIEFHDRKLDASLIHQRILAFSLTQFRIDSLQFRDTPTGVLIHEHIAIGMQSHRRCRTFGTYRSHNQPETSLVLFPVGTVQTRCFPLISMGTVRERAVLGTSSRVPKQPSCTCCILQISSSVTIFIAQGSFRSAIWGSLKAM